MEPLLAFFALVLVIVVTLSPILALLAHLRSRRLEKDVRRLENRLRTVEAEQKRDSAPRVQAPAASKPKAELPFKSRPIDPVVAASTAAEPSVSAEPASPEPVAVPTPAAQPTAAAPSEAAPAPATPPVQRPRAQRAPRPKVQWEQWVGVRGAAVAGGLILAIAGLLFFKHAFDKGWITPAMRVFTGAVVGLLAIGAGELFRRRRYRFAPAAATGGGIVVLYATVWASHRLYEFTSALAALPLMAVVTATCAWLSVRFKSQLVAILGLVGGFATPLLLSIESNHPIGLFGYLLLLDLGLLGLGQRMKWPSLGVLGMLGTFIIELVWTLKNLDSQFFPLALASLGAFALLFAAAGLRSPASERRKWFASQAGALLLPFAFATYFAAIADFGDALWPLALLIAFLAVGASWVGSKQNAKWLVTGAAAGALSVTGMWLIRTGISDGRAFEYAFCTLGLGAVFMLAEHYFGRSEDSEVQSRWAAPVSPAIVCVGFAGMNVLAAIFYLDVSPWPWLAAALGQALLLHSQGKADRAGPLRVVGASLAGLVLGIHLVDISHTSLEGVPSNALTMSWMVGCSLLFLVLAFASSKRDGEPEARWAWHASVVFPLVLLLMLPESGVLIGSSPALAIFVSVMLAVLALVPSALRGWSGWYGVTLVLYLTYRAEWLSLFLQDAESSAIAGDLFLLELAAIALFAAVPLLAKQRLGATRLAWAFSGLLLCFALPGLDRLVSAHFDVTTSWQSYAVLCALATLLGVAARFLLASGARFRESALRWMFGVAIFHGCFTVSQYLDHNVFLVGAALTGLGLAILWRVLPSFPLKLGAVVFCGASSAALTMLVLSSLGGRLHFEGAATLVWNWTSYVSGVPALCLIGASMLISQRERQLLTNVELRSPLKGKAWSTMSLALLGLLLVFIWINLQVYVYFETTDQLHLGLGRDHAARDLTLSICWILYAMLLLAIGMSRSVSGLRQISLGFLLLTLVKVFLHDLGDLEGLYRVGSLFGLAVSLLLVSLLYQRFVFPRGSGAGEAIEPGLS